MAVAVGGARKRTSEQAWRSLLSGLEVISIADICGHISGYYGPLKINGGAHTHRHTHTHTVHTWLHCSPRIEQVESGRLLLWAHDLLVMLLRLFWEWFVDMFLLSMVAVRQT